MSTLVIGALVGLGFVLLFMVSLLKPSKSSEQPPAEPPPEPEAESETETETEPEPEPEAETESESEPESETEPVDEDEAEVQSATDSDPLPGTESPNPAELEDVPRPPGTPAQAAPVAGASAWLLRGVSAAHPEEASPGDSVDVALLLTSIDPSEVDVVPNDVQPWTAGPVEVDYEVHIDGAASASGVEIAGRFTVEAQGDLRVDLPLMVAFSLSGIELKVRFYAAGYEVGRARLFVPGRGQAGEGDGLGEGVLAIPDTILSAPEG